MSSCQITMGWLLMQEKAPADLMDNGGKNGPSNCTLSLGPEAPAGRRFLSGGKLE